jgi:hypothetical protein
MGKSKRLFLRKVSIIAVAIVFCLSTVTVAHAASGSASTPWGTMIYTLQNFGSQDFEATTRINSPTAAYTYLSVEIEIVKASTGEYIASGGQTVYYPTTYAGVANPIPLPTGYTKTIYSAHQAVGYTSVGRYLSITF